jgi:hypothetical protein
MSHSKSQRPPSLKPAVSREAFRRLQTQRDFQSPKDSTGFKPVVIKLRTAGEPSGRASPSWSGNWVPSLPHHRYWLRSQATLLFQTLPAHPRMSFSLTSSKAPAFMSIHERTTFSGFPADPHHGGKHSRELLPQPHEAPARFSTAHLGTFTGWSTKNPMRPRNANADYRVNSSYGATAGSFPFRRSPD